MDEKFDAIRNYARYGIWDTDKLCFRFQDKPLDFCNLPNKHSHAVGWAWKVENNTNYLMGIVTWFGSLTYEFKIYEEKDAFSMKRINDSYKAFAKKKLLETWMLYGDNEKRQATEENSWFIIQSK